jgi:N utilization substance protein B
MSAEIKNSREWGRELAFFSLYVYDMGNSSLEELSCLDWYQEMAAFCNEEGVLSSVPSHLQKDTSAFLKLLLNGTVSNLQKIDEVIRNHLVKWDFERLHWVDKAILRVSIYSMIYLLDMPAEVIIAEANQLAENYSMEKASNYINGILHRVKQEYRKNILVKDQGKKIKIKLKKAE